MKKSQLVLFIGMLCVAFSCQNEPQKVRTKVEERYYNLAKSGWKSTAISNYIGVIAYKATLVPLPYYIFKNEGSDDLKRIDSIYNSLKEERVIEIEFQQEDKDDLLKSKYTHRDYEASVKYMSFKIRNDFSAVTQSGDTIYCSGVTFERNFKVAPFKRVLLHFGNIPEEENIQLLYHDQLFGNGFMKFQFTETPILL